MLIALVSALVALGVSGGSDATAHSSMSDQATHATVGHGKAGISKKELALRQKMRRLWEDHVTWTGLQSSVSPRIRPTPRRPSAGCVEPGRHRQRDQAVLRRRGRAAADRAPARAHPDRRRPDRRRKGRRPGRRDRSAGAVDGQRRRDRDLPVERESAQLEARGDEGHDARPPEPHDRRSRRAPAAATGRPTSRPTTGSTARSCTWRTCSRPASSSSSRTASRSVTSALPPRGTTVSRGGPFRGKNHASVRH